MSSRAPTSRLAVVDESTSVLVYDLGTKALVFEDKNANSVAGPWPYPTYSAPAPSPSPPPAPSPYRMLNLSSTCTLAGG